MGVNSTCILPEGASSFFLSPVTAIVAKYWMTRFVFTVFPAPDSPLRGQNESQNIRQELLPYQPKLSRQKGMVSTYVIRMDWFSRSVKGRNHQVNRSTDTTKVVFFFFSQVLGTKCKRCAN